MCPFLIPLSIPHTQTQTVSGCVRDWTQMQTRQRQAPQDLTFKYMTYILRTGMPCDWRLTGKACCVLKCVFLFYSALSTSESTGFRGLCTMDVHGKNNRVIPNACGDNVALGCEIAWRVSILHFNQGSAPFLQTGRETPVNYSWLPSPHSLCMVIRCLLWLWRFLIPVQRLWYFSVSQAHTDRDRVI